MSRLVFSTFACLVVVGAYGRAQAAPSVEAFAGAVGGVAAAHDVPGVCSTYGAPEPIRSFFPSSLVMGIPQGGIAFCGYSGDTGSTSAAAGPIMASRSVGPVLLGNAGFAGTYTGSAEASADFKTLKAVARGMETAPGSGSPVSLGNSSAAALFEDTFTATSPGIAVPSAGLVRYTFAFEGSLSAPGPVMPNIQGFAGATLHIEHDGGPNFEIVRVDVVRGSAGTLHAVDGTMGTFVAGPSSITGGGTFTSAIIGQFGEVIDRPFSWGQPFRLKVGLMATTIGDGVADFASTARLVRIDFFDAAHRPISEVAFTSASGTAYGDAITADAGAADAPVADAGADAGAIDAAAVDAGGADAGATDAAAVDAVVADAALADAPSAVAAGDSGGCSCSTAAGGAGSPVLLLLLLMVWRLGRGATSTIRSHRRQIRHPLTRSPSRSRLR